MPYCQRIQESNKNKFAFPLDVLAEFTTDARAYISPQNVLQNIIPDMAPMNLQIENIVVNR